MGIFARVLQDVLVAHGRSTDRYPSRVLGGQSPRTDPVWYPLRRLAISPEIIRRLKQAAVSDERRASLNPADLEYIDQQLGFTPDEWTRLRAALIAQGVEIFLYDRLEESEAGVASAVALTVFERLLETPDGGAFARVRSDLPGVQGELEKQIELALFMADRAAAMVEAARAARKRDADAEARFWRKLAAAAYNEAATLAASIEPEMGAFLRRHAESLEQSQDL